MTTYDIICPHCDRDTGLPRGLSAQSIFAVLNGHQGNHYPHDPGDFGRCVTYLDSIEETAPTWMRDVSPIWRDLVDNWEELTDMYNQQIQTGKRGGMYARMKEIIEPHYKKFGVNK